MLFYIDARNIDYKIFRHTIQVWSQERATEDPHSVWTGQCSRNPEAVPESTLRTGAECLPADGKLRPGGPLLDGQWHREWRGIGGDVFCHFGYFVWIFQITV